MIYQGGIKASVKEFATYISKEEPSPVTEGDDTYYVYRYEDKINDLENAVILICWSKADLSDKPAFILSTDISLTTFKILTFYQNLWDIEVSYWYYKNYLGFGEYPVESLTSIKRFWSMVFITYTLRAFQGFKQKASEASKPWRYRRIFP